MAIICTHLEEKDRHNVCVHLLEVTENYITCYRFYTGKGTEFVLVCAECKETPETIEAHSLCSDCFTDVQDDLVGIVGKPENVSRASNLVFRHSQHHIEGFNSESMVDIHPLPHVKYREWIALTHTNTIMRINFDTQEIERLCDIPQTSDGVNFTSLHLSPSSDVAVLYSRLGREGVVLELASGKVLMNLQRNVYHSNVTPFPVAFFEWEGRLLLIHSTIWNRLDISDPRTGEELTARHLTSPKSGEPRPATYLDYFHAQLTVSPDQLWIADDGWVWHPFGIMATWSLAEWIQNPWTSENGKSNRRFCERAYFWSGPTCWVNERTLAIWGYGEDDELLIPAVRIFDVTSGEELGWFPGPEVERTEWYPKALHYRDTLVFDDYLFSISQQHGVQVWDLPTGARLLEDASFYPFRYHRGSKEFLTPLPNGDFQLSRLTEVTSFS